MEGEHNQGSTLEALYENFLVSDEQCSEGLSSSNLIDDDDDKFVVELENFLSEREAGIKETGNKVKDNHAEMIRPEELSKDGWEATDLIDLSDLVDDDFVKELDSLLHETEMETMNEGFNNLQQTVNVESPPVALMNEREDLEEKGLQSSNSFILTNDFIIDMESFLAAPFKNSQEIGNCNVEDPYGQDMIVNNNTCFTTSSDQFMRHKEQMRINPYIFQPAYPQFPESHQSSWNSYHGNILGNINGCCCRCNCHGRVMMNDQYSYGYGTLTASSPAPLPPAASNPEAIRISTTHDQGGRVEEEEYHNNKKRKTWTEAYVVLRGFEGTWSWQVEDDRQILCDNQRPHTNS